MIPDARNQKGVALFLVLWVMALLTVIVGEFCHAMRTEIQISTGFKEGLSARYIALAGMNMGINELLRIATTPPAPPADADDKAVENPWRLDADMEPIPFGDGSFQVRLDSENGKLNINGCGMGLLDIIIRGLKLPDEQRDIIVNSILDWRDPDRQHQLNGAEDEYYERLDQPYRAKNGDFDSVEELRMVRGITPEVYSALKDLVTVYPWSAGEARRYEVGEGEVNYSKINVSAASEAMLALLPDMTPELAAQVVEARMNQPFRALSDLTPIIGIEVFKLVEPWVTLDRGAVYRLASRATLPDGRTTHAAQAVIRIDLTLESKYQVIKWNDDVLPDGMGMSEMLP